MDGDASIPQLLANHYAQIIKLKQLLFVIEFLPADLFAILQLVNNVMMETMIILMLALILAQEILDVVMGSLMLDKSVTPLQLSQLLVAQLPVQSTMASPVPTLLALHLCVLLSVTTIGLIHQYTVTICSRIIKFVPWQPMKFVIMDLTTSAVLPPAQSSMAFLAM